MQMGLCATFNAELFMVAEHSFRVPMPCLSLLLNWLSPSAQNWQDISLKYRLAYFGSFIELCDVSMATRLALNRL